MPRPRQSNNMRGISYLSLALQESLLGLATSHTFSETADTGVQFINDEGDIYVPYYNKIGPRESGDDRIPLFIPEGDIDGRFGNLKEYPSWRNNNIDAEVITLNFNESISIATLLRQLAEDDATYGVVLQEEGSRSEFAMNPLHPLVAFMVVSGLYEMPKSGKLHIYKFKQRGIRAMRAAAENTSAIDSYVVDYEKLFALTPKIVRNPITVRQQATIADATLDVIAETPFIESIQDLAISVQRTTSAEGEIDVIQSLIIPTQLIVDGTLAPYYGLCNITQPTNGNMVGCSLSPMATGNINRGANNGDKYYDSMTVNTGSICTGGTSSSSARGWFTLCRINLNSMHYGKILDADNVYPFIKASKNISRGIWAVVEEKELAAAASETSATETPVAAEATDPD